LKHGFEFAFGRESITHLQVAVDDGLLDLFDNILEDTVLFGDAKQVGHRSAARSWVNMKLNCV
jgi:hypothetical protein